MTSGPDLSLSEDSDNAGKHAPGGEVLFRSAYLLDAGDRNRLGRATLVNHFMETRTLWKYVIAVAVLFVGALICYLFVGAPTLPFLIVGSIGVAGLMFQAMYYLVKVRSTPRHASMVKGTSFRVAFGHDRFQVDNPAGQKRMFRYSSFTGLKTRLGFVFLDRADLRGHLILPCQLFTPSNLAWLENRIRGENE
jgi:hypothetical protein